MRYSARTGRLGSESDAWQVHELAAERLRSGEEIFLLSIGDPDFETPAPIRDAAVRALAAGRTHYSPCPGEPELRRAIAELATRELERRIEPDQVTIFPGAQAALFALAQCLFDPDDEVVVLDPTYPTYDGLLGAAGARVRTVPLRAERGFALDPRELAAAVTPRTRGLLLNFPHNPTGVVLTPSQAAAVAELCIRHDLVLLSDEVYAALCFGERMRSPTSLPGMPERSAVVSSLSKSHIMTGWRLGWSVTPPELAGHLTNLARCMHFGVTQFVQDAGVAALREGAAGLAELRREYAARARAFVEGLAGAPGIHCRMPEAGMYIFADVRGTGMSGDSFARELLEATGVAVMPGEGFGESGAGHIRITLGTSAERLREACRRIAGFARARSQPKALTTH